MTELNDLLKRIVTSMVDNPEQVEISEITSDHSVILELTVAKSDLGKVIGKKGNNAHAIRSILNAASGKSRHRITLEILE